MESLTDSMLAPGPGQGIDRAFDRAMTRLGPFEPHPELAVAVSGGADSLTLALLADRWARGRGGRITALTVDHGLRREAADEARQVGRWLKAAGIRHRILRWSPQKAAPKAAQKAALKAATKDGGKKVGARPHARLANLQGAARDARYDLLCDWCRDHTVLHLLLAHHRDDQAETFLLRLARGSGLDGLAAMAPLAERGAVRLLRPLLGMSKAQLTAFLAARGQAWIEDPSNQDTANARVRVRRLVPRLAAEGMTITRLAETAERLAQARIAVDALVARLLAQSVAVYPQGYLRLDTFALRSAEREIGLRALARAIACIGGSPYVPRLARLTRLYDMLCAGQPENGERALGRGRTLGGCRIVPAGAERDGTPRAVLIVREPAAVAPPIRLTGDQAVAGARVIWDGRFMLSMTGPIGVSLSIGALGDDDWRELQRAGLKVPGAMPRDAIVTLPALRRRAAVLAVPCLGYADDCHNIGKKVDIAAWQTRFAPFSPLTRPGFTLV